MPNAHKMNRQKEKYRLLLCQDIGLVKGKKKNQLIIDIVLLSSKFFSCVVSL